MIAILFDMDGVLAANTYYHVKAWTEFAREYGRDVTEDDIKQRLGFNNREYMRFVLDRDPTESEVRDATERKEALYREIYASALCAPAGLITLLESFRRAELSCGVATSAPAVNVDFVMDGLGIRDYFKEIVDASHVKHCKPDPETYRLAASKLNSSPEECIVFEDAIAGIQSGKRAGMKVVAITTSYPADVLRKHNPDAIIESFTDLQAPCEALEVIRSVCGAEFKVCCPAESGRF